MNTAAKTYISSVIAAALAIVVAALWFRRTADSVDLLVFLGLFIGAAALKCRLPRIEGTYSAVFFFALLGSHILSMADVLFCSAIAGIVQCTFNVLRRPSVAQVLFNAASQIISTASAAVFVRRLVPGLTASPLVVLLILAAAMYYLVNTMLVSTVLTLVQKKPLVAILGQWRAGALPYYLAGALIAGITISSANGMSSVMAFYGAGSMIVATVYYRYWFRTLFTAS